MYELSDFSKSAKTLNYIIHRCTDTDSRQIRMKSSRYGHSAKCPMTTKLPSLDDADGNFTGILSRCSVWENKKAVLSQTNRAMPQLLFFGLKFADNIHYKFKSSQTSKAKLQSSKRTGEKQNLTQNGHSRSRVLESVERR